MQVSRGLPGSQEDRKLSQGLQVSWQSYVCDLGTGGGSDGQGATPGDPEKLAEFLR